MTNIEKNQEQQNDLSALELQAKNLSPDQKNEIGTNVDVEKALLDWRDTGAYKVLPASYQEFIEDLKKIDYTPDNKYIQQIRAYIFAKEKVSVDIKALRQSNDGLITSSSKTIALQNIYVDLRESAILAYKQSNTGGIASGDKLPEKVTLADMKLLDNINTKISDKKYIDMMQIVQRCKDDDRFIKSDESLSSPEIFYKKVSDEIVGKNNNQNISYPIVDLFSTLLFGKKLQISTGGPFGEQGEKFILPHNKEGGSNIGYKTIMAIPELTWDDISHDMAEYIKPKLESLFPYHQYTYRETNKGKGTLILATNPSYVFQKLKDDRDTRYRKRIEESGVGVDNTYPVINNNFETLSTDKREALSLCLSNTSGLPGEVYGVQQEYNNKVLKEMGIKTIQQPFGRMNIASKTADIYTPDQIKNWTMGEGSNDKALAALYSAINDAERYGRLLRFEPSGTGYKLVQYNTGYAGGIAREVNFLNRRIDKSGLHI